MSTIDTTPAHNRSDFGPRVKSVFINYETKQLVMLGEDLWDHTDLYTLLALMWEFDESKCREWLKLIKPDMNDWDEWEGGPSIWWLGGSVFFFELGIEVDTKFTARTTQVTLT